jgi:hypothetical protein
MFLVSARALVLSLSLITRVSSKVHKGGRKRSKRGGGPMAACSAAYLAGAGLVAPGCDDASSCCSADGLNLFASSLELLPLVKDAGGAITAAGFTRMCELTLPLIESFGPAFSMVRNDIRNNVEVRAGGGGGAAGQGGAGRGRGRCRARRRAAATSARGPPPRARALRDAPRGMRPAGSAARDAPPAAPPPRAADAAPPPAPGPAPQRIRKRQATDPARFELLFPIVLDEVARRDDNHSQSCTKAVLWLKRCAPRAGPSLRRRPTSGQPAHAPPRPAWPRARAPRLTCPWSPPLVAWSSCLPSSRACWSCRQARR